MQPMAMVLFPEAQKRAQEEIGSIIGNGLLPEWNDRKDLPYIHEKKTLTDQPGVPSTPSAAVPHSDKEDDVYNGMVISKRSMGFTINPTRDFGGAIVPINRDAVTPGLIVRPEDFESQASHHGSLVKGRKHLDSEGNFTPEFIDSVFGKEK
ncbi:uncharacterized protein NECHADRAFT_88699 [Fusarium vanettenii 77-13-4]|uniref:Uncharacterized protein n=1 Tax=Fusarium vanettenii (strain ATCC MYA-4622 / CBS 123669 / FGSC 9596 / NRRL 45880 / 77-13-4) TaxID=660122 RepID=C7ZLJ6_FUSV7|nr:uncharacterized protein NECHADRAFT_88699 [Fusarium vanettenii 77-13-4]EEU35128.1 hypothetical protein NECHADRAFT_88699 [Fusarium vanettenii 77-13-4]